MFDTEKVSTVCVVLGLLAALGIGVGILLSSGNHNKDVREQRRACAAKGWIVNEFNCKGSRSNRCDWQCVPPFQPLPESPEKP